MAEVVWVDDAANQLDEIVAYIEQFDPWAADEIATRLKRVAASLSDFPNRGRPASGGMREMTSVPPYILRYRVSRDARTVTISAVRHSRRRPL